MEILALWANQKATKVWDTPTTSGAMVYMVFSPRKMKEGVL